MPVTMRLGWVLAATGCWAAPSQPVAPAPARAAATACIVREDYVGSVPISPIALASDGRIFARPGQVERIELDTRGTMQTESSAMVLRGEIDLATFSLRPRDAAPRDGWLVVDAGRVRAVTDGVARLVVELPPALAPTTAEVGVPCRELTARSPEFRDDGGRLVTLAAGGELRERPGGAIVARVAADAPAYELARGGSSVKVLITSGTSSVVAWVAASSVGAPPPGQLDGGFGYGRSGTGPSGAWISCSRELPIYARTSRGEVRVGKLKPGNGVQAVDKDSTPDATAIDLGGDVSAYLRTSDLAASCP